MTGKQDSYRRLCLSFYALRALYFYFLLKKKKKNKITPSVRAGAYALFLLFKYKGSVGGSDTLASVREALAHKT
jgi:hypothetical protein